MAETRKNDIGIIALFGLLAVAGNAICLIPVLLMGLWLIQKGKTAWVLAFSVLGALVPVLLKLPCLGLLFATVIPVFLVAHFGKTLSFSALVWMAGGLFALGLTASLLSVYITVGGVLSQEGLRNALDFVKGSLAPMWTSLPSGVDSELLNEIAELVFFVIPGAILFCSSCVGFATALFVASGREGIRPLLAQVNPTKLSAVVYIACMVLSAFSSATVLGITALTMKLALTPMFVLFEIFAFTLRLKAKAISIMSTLLFFVLVLSFGVFSALALLGAFETVRAVKIDLKKE